MKRSLDSPPPEISSSSKRVCLTGEVGLSSLKRRLPGASMSASLSNLDQWLGMFESWTGEERKVALDELVARCDASLQRHLLGIVEPQFQRDFISLLPKELAFMVLSNLEPKDLLRAAQTCRYWKSLCDDNLLVNSGCHSLQVTHNWF
jgi:F-box/WD-40 domain protein 7